MGRGACCIGARNKIAGMCGHPLSLRPARPHKKFYTRARARATRGLSAKVALVVQSREQEQRWDVERAALSQEAQQLQRRLAAEAEQRQREAEAAALPEEPSDDDRVECLQAESERLHARIRDLEACVVLPSHTQAPLCRHSRCIPSALACVLPLLVCAHSTESACLWKFQADLRRERVRGSDAAAATCEQVRRAVEETAKAASIDARKQAASGHAL